MTFDSRTPWAALFDGRDRREGAAAAEGGTGRVDRRAARRVQHARRAREVDDAAVVGEERPRAGGGHVRPDAKVVTVAGAFVSSAIGVDAGGAGDGAEGHGAARAVADVHDAARRLVDGSGRQVEAPLPPSTRTAAPVPVPETEPANVTEPAWFSRLRPAPVPLVVTATLETLVAAQRSGAEDRRVVGGHDVEAGDGRARRQRDRVAARVLDGGRRRRRQHGGRAHHERHPAAHQLLARLQLQAQHVVDRGRAVVQIDDVVGGVGIARAAGAVHVRQRVERGRLGAGAARSRVAVDEPDEARRR